MSRALVGVLVEGPTDPTNAASPSPNAPSTQATATRSATRRARGIAGRAACAADSWCGPMTVCRAGCDGIRSVCRQAAGESAASNAASRALARAQRLLTVPSGIPNSAAASATE